MGPLVDIHKDFGQSLRFGLGESQTHRALVLWMVFRDPSFLSRKEFGETTKQFSQKNFEMLVILVYG